MYKNYPSNFFSKKISPLNTISGLQNQLEKLGLRLEPNTGHLFYNEKFRPLNLSFELVFVRHGETYGNCGQSSVFGKIDKHLVEAGIKNYHLRIFQGNIDEEINQLTETGKKQALIAAEKLNQVFSHRGKFPDVILISPLTRAKDTALPFITANKLEDKIIIDEDIKEISFGAWENKRVCDFDPSDVCHAFYRDQNVLVKCQDENNNNSDNFSENFAELLLRAYHALNKLNKLYSGKIVLMFSHSMFGAACNVLLGKSPKIEQGYYLAFDGKKSDGTPYALPHAAPVFFNFKIKESNQNTQLKNLSVDSIKLFPSEIIVPQYQLDKIQPGIFHIGASSCFFRSHLAVYLDDLMNIGLGNEWGVYGVCLKSTIISNIMAKQDYLYSLIETDQHSTRVRVIGSIKKIFNGHTDREMILSEMAKENICIVSLTITANGYGRDSTTGLLDKNHPDICHDLEHPQQPISALGYMVEALARRKEKEILPFTVLSCDNLPGNGDIARKMILEMADSHDKDLKGWIESHGKFPNTMVDRIAPKVTNEHRDYIKKQHQIEDNAVVVAEPFKQFIIEDTFPYPRPSWERAGVQVVKDASPYYQLKLTLLNASHTIIGLLGAHYHLQYIHEVTEHPVLHHFLRHIMDNEFTPILPKVEIDIENYKNNLFQRFANHVLKDRVDRVGEERTRKINNYILPSLIKGLKNNSAIEGLVITVALWLISSNGTDIDGNPINLFDPKAESLQTIRQCLDEILVNDREKLNRQTTKLMLTNSSFNYGFFRNSRNDRAEALPLFQQQKEKIRQMVLLYPSIFSENLTNSEGFLNTLTVALISLYTVGLNETIKKVKGQPTLEPMNLNGPIGGMS